MLVQIKAATPDLSRAEQRVARWVVEHPRQASRSTLAGVPGTGFAELVEADLLPAGAFPVEGGRGSEFSA